MKPMLAHSESPTVLSEEVLQLASVIVAFPVCIENDFTVCVYVSSRRLCRLSCYTRAALSLSACRACNSMHDSHTDMLKQQTVHMISVLPQFVGLCCSLQCSLLADVVLWVLYTCFIKLHKPLSEQSQQSAYTKSICQPVYVGAACRETYRQIEKCLEENPQLANVYTPESHFSVRTSMYNRNARSQSVAPIHGKNLIRSSGSGQERDALQRRYDEVAQVSISGTFSTT